MGCGGSGGCGSGQSSIALVTLVSVGVVALVFGAGWEVSSSMVVLVMAKVDVCVSMWYSLV